MDTSLDISSQLVVPEGAIPVVAMVLGRPVTELPADLFIPPDALEILLDSFTGPLDLLLYLIRRQNIDIMDIPIVLITQQYMQYIELLEERRIELAADYLVMAAMLAEIKSRLLLPPDPTAELMDEEDPRMALVKRLQIYEQFKYAACSLNELPRWERDTFQVQLSCKIETIKPYPDVALSALVHAMRAINKRQLHQLHHTIEREPLSVRERMVIILQYLQEDQWLDFVTLLKRQEQRLGVVVSFLAILELAKQSLITIMQTAAYMPIYLKKTSL